jgi:hypothetical protein
MGNLFLIDSAKPTDLRYIPDHASLLSLFKCDTIRLGKYATGARLYPQSDTLYLNLIRSGSSCHHPLRFYAIASYHRSSIPYHNLFAPTQGISRFLMGIAESGFILAISAPSARVASRPIRGEYLPSRWVREEWT